MRVLVVADTHIPDHARGLPDVILAEARHADLILHAGDATQAAVLERLARFAPVQAVVGNNDDDDVAAWGAQQALELEIGGIAVALIHDAGPARGRAGRMHRRFPNASVVIFGHSHIPMDVGSADQVRLVNPGSPTWKRRQPYPTYAIVEFGRRIDVDIKSIA